MFGKTPYYALNQMTKMGIRTGPDCRADVPGLLAAGLAQAGCANHFAGFHIGLCVGNGWVAGRSAIEDLDRLPAPRVDAGRVQLLARRDHAAVEGGGRQPNLDRILRDLQAVMFAYDVGILKRADRIRARVAGGRCAGASRFASIAAPHTHELVRLKETEAMLLAAQFMLGASLFRTESRLSHFRDDYPAARRRQLAGLDRHLARRRATRVEEDTDSDPAVPCPGALRAPHAPRPTFCGRRQLELHR